jgi:alpha-galactosidase
MTVTASDKLLRHKGLDSEKQYTVCGTEEKYGGDELMYSGFPILLINSDFKSCMWKLKSVNSLS